MLASLAIRDFAIIEELALEFGPGFNALTGETGAGKSILVGALGLALGDKAHPDLVRTGAEEARVEAVFTGLPGSWRSFLEERGVPAAEEGELVVQRRVGRARSQAWLNGAAVPLAVLAEAGSRLVDIHGQHQHQSLLRVSNHVEVLDDHGGLAPLRERFRGLFLRLAELDRRIRAAAEDRAAREQRRDFLRFQLRELEAAGLEPGEDEELERARSLLQNAERLSLVIREALDLLYDGEAAAAGQVEAASARLAELARHLPGGAPGAEGLPGAAAAIREAADSLRDLLGRTRYDPEEHARVEERLALISRLRRKYGDTVEAMLARLEELRAEADALGDAEGSVETWKRDRAETLAGLAVVGGELRAGRERTARRLEKEVSATLAGLGMGKARFVVRLTPRLAAGGAVELEGKRHEPWEGGLEEVEFLLAANPGEEPKGLARVASGGELSRIMLALKASLARVDRVNTLVFDEIDTGIGGATARTVGRTLRRLAGERQVFCVTHLPQIAALAESHFSVAKRVERGRARVSVTRLEAGDRVAELARMIAGERVTPAAEAHARELMEV